MIRSGGPAAASAEPEPVAAPTPAKAAAPTKAAPKKGDAVNATGHLTSQPWTPQQGERAGVEQQRIVLVADTLGPDLRFAEAAVTRNARQAPGVDF